MAPGLQCHLPARHCGLTSCGLSTLVGTECRRRSSLVSRCLRPARLPRRVRPLLAMLVTVLARLPSLTRLLAVTDSVGVRACTPYHAWGNLLKCAEFTGFLTHLLMTDSWQSHLHSAGNRHGSVLHVLLDAATQS